jgi:hypothetical protein
MPRSARRHHRHGCQPPDDAHSRREADRLAGRSDAVDTLPPAAIEEAALGASEWSRKVAYQADFEAALRQAREDAYREGDFYRQESDEKARRMSEEEYAAADLPYSEGI